MIVRHRTSKSGRTQHPDTQGPGGRDQVRNVATAASQEAFVFETRYRTADADVIGSRWTLRGQMTDPSKVPFKIGAAREGSPLQIFHAAPGSAAMRQLPWSFVPTVLVPFWLILHAIIWAQLRRLRSLGAVK